MHRVLAIDPNKKGFGYVVLEDESFAVDWGLAVVRRPRHAHCVERVARLWNDYRPDVLVIEDPRDPRSRRCARVRRLLQEVQRWADATGVHIRCYSTRRVRRAFARCGAKTKEQIAAVVVTQLPELAPRLPPHRKCYMPEDPRTAIFDAAALALTLLAAGSDGAAVGRRRSLPDHPTSESEENRILPPLSEPAETVGSRG